MFIAAFISFTSFLLVLHHLPAHWLRRIVGYAGWVDLLLHGSILWMFLGTSTLGLLQAEAAGILFSVYLRVYRWMFGFEHYIRENGKYVWARYAGHLTRYAR